MFPHVQVHIFRKITKHLKVQAHLGLGLGLGFGLELGLGDLGPAGGFGEDASLVLFWQLVGKLRSFPEGMLLQSDMPFLEQMFALSEEHPQLLAMDDPLSLEPAVYVEAHLPAACTAAGRTATSSVHSVRHSTQVLPEMAIRCPATCPRGYPQSL